MKKNYIICLSILLVFVWSSDLHSQKYWERMEDMPEATNWYGSCYDSVSKKAYIFGGGNNDHFHIATTQIYDFENDKWELGADMPDEASAFTAEIVNGKIYIIGEHLVPSVLTHVKEYDPVKDTFITKAQLPEIFYGHGSCVYDGLIYSFGGRVDSKENTIVRTYDPLTDTWDELADMPIARESSAVCIYEDEIYLFGGNPSLKYTPLDSSWTELNAGECEISAYAVPIIDGDRILLFGGYKSGVNYPNPSDEVWAYYPALDTLEKFDHGMPFKRFTRGHKYNNQVYLFGGHYSNTLGSVTDTVWRLDLDYVSINENEYVSRKDFILHQNHPNPFSTSTTIEYELRKSVKVQITMYNHLGKQVKVIEKKQSRGKQQIIWNAERLPAGIYFCVLKTNAGMQTMKMIKL